MDLSYTCVNNNCSFPGVNSFEVTFKPETIMDENNVASLFCPFCGSELMLVHAPDVSPENLPKDSTI